MARADRPGLVKAAKRPGRRARIAQPGGVRWLAATDIVTDHSDAVIIGAGATGVGLLWDLTLRGFNVILVEQAGLAAGTSGAFHGLLHSGARYAGTDPQTASECLAENRVLRRVAHEFVGRTGGVFARLEQDDSTWENRWLDGCRRAGLRPTRIRRDLLLACEPRLSPDLVSAYRVPDASVDGFGLLWSMLWSSASAGARVYFRARVVEFLTDEAGVRGVRVIGLGGTEGTAPKAVARTRRHDVEPGEIIASVVVNATGPWAAETASLAGPQAAAAVPVEQDRGVMVVFNARLVSTVVNRLRPPGDGDIFVPHGPVTILGTSSARVARPGRAAPTSAEVELVMNEGRALVPGIDDVPPLRAYAGVRPLLVSPAAGLPGPLKSTAADRGSGRGFLLIDHGHAGGPEGLVSVAGGKFTTFRAMAASAGDLVTRLLGKKAPCRTAEVGIPRMAQGPPLAAPGAAGDAPEGLSEPLTCECEFINTPHLLSLLDSGLGLADIRRVARVGMGGCQGVFCGPRLAGVMWLSGWPGNRRRPRSDEAAIAAETSAFREGRLGGVRPVEWGTQARLSALARALDRLTMGERDR